MKTSVTQEDMLQFFWKRDDAPQYSEEHSVKAAVRPSKDFVDYTLPLEGQKGWQGRITELRLDPVCTPGVKIEIESIRLE